MAVLQRHDALWPCCLICLTSAIVNGTATHCQAVPTSLPSMKESEVMRRRPHSLTSDSSWSLLQISRRPLSSGCFGAFSQDESTYDEDGWHESQDNPFWDVKYGRDPVGQSSPEHTPTMDSEFFHESRSAGPSGAWQTHYPSGEDRVVGNPHSENPWRYTPISWVQDYVPSEERGSPDSPDLWSRRADEFDNSVNQIDNYGRRKMPSYFSGRQYQGQYPIDGWKERSVKTTIACKEVGCSARALLHLFDHATEDARSCKLSVVVHPTDYEDDWSREVIEYWKVNDFIVSSNCNPRARGCNQTAEKPQYHCVRDFDLEQFIRSNGTLVLEGKNSQMVDECPHNDNLLSALAMGTCMVRNKSSTTTTTLFTMDDLYAEGVLKCIDPGCTASTTLHISPELILNGGKCALSMNVTQTDYDDKLGVPEELEFIKVGNQNITSKAIQPGRNPCNEEYKGKIISAEDRTYRVEEVEKFDVTRVLRGTYPVGQVRIAAKISPQVDECGYDGHLFHAKVRLICAPPANFTAEPPQSLPLLFNDTAAVDQVVSNS